MKKLVLLATAALLVSGVSFASNNDKGKKSCKKSCKSGKSCCKAKDKDKEKEAKL